jgi:Magnesium chelatase, subunit ChlI
MSHLRNERLTRQLTTSLPPTTLDAAMETTRIHPVAGPTGDRPALLMTRSCRLPHQTISDAGLMGGVTCRCQARCRWPTMACSFWMNGRSFAAMPSRSCGNRSRRVSYSRHSAPPHSFWCIFSGGIVHTAFQGV